MRGPFVVAVVVLVVLGACGSRAPAPMPPLPHAAYAHYLDGRLAGYRDDWVNAVAALTDAAAAAPDQPMLAVELARAQARAKRADAAKVTLAAARAKWPQHSQVWIASGDLLAATGDQAAIAEAIKFFRRAIELAPSEERAYLGLAKLESAPAALATLRRLVERVPTSVEGHYRLGQRFAIARDLVNAIATLRKVLELDPDHIDGRLDLARGLRMQGKLDEAIAQTRSAFDRSGQALDLAEELFYVLLEADDLVAAVDLLTLLDDDRSDADSLLAVARHHRGLGRIPEARTIAAKLAKVDSELGILVSADIELAIGDPASAALLALGIQPESERFAIARRVAATCLLAMAEPQRALDALAPARTALPKDLELATAAAYALVDLGRRTEALEVFDQLEAKPAVILARARVADRAGDLKAALALAETVLRDKPDHAAALNLAGYLLADSNQRLPDAERYLRRARELQAGDPAVLDSWGWLLYRKRDYKAAIRVLDRAARYAPLEAEILVHLAAAHIGAGSPGSASGLLASGLLDRAVALRPPVALRQRIDALRKQLPRSR